MNDRVAAQATATIEAGSKSFAAAARLFEPQIRRGAVMLYAWCRHCDDVIDGQELGYGQREQARGEAAGRLLELEDLTRRAYRGEAVADPAFQAFQLVVREHAVPERFPLEHLAGFRMDVEGFRPQRIEDTLGYCYGVAGVVGVMMAMIMGARDEDTLDRACDLGVAFQLTNIARDVVEDAEVGRVYLPADWLLEAGIPPSEVQDARRREALAGCAARLLAVADQHYESAAIGIGALPLRSAWAIATARGVYRQIGEKVIARGSRAWDSRTSTTRGDKLRHIAGGAALAIASRRAKTSPRPPELWTRRR